MPGHASLREAEKAAINGGNEGPDTQQCKGMMDEVLSSSPPTSPASPPVRSPPKPSNFQVEREVEPDNASRLNAELPIKNPSAITVNPRYELVLQHKDDAPDEQPSNSCIKLLAHEPLNECRIGVREQELAGPSNGATDNVPVRAPVLTEKEATPHLKPADGTLRMRINAMSVDGDIDDFTQKSVMSATQANSESVYEQFPIQRQQIEQQPILQKLPHSVITESTVLTYGENDTGHVNFDSYLANYEDVDDNVSQDGSFAPEAVVSERSPAKSFEPRTPAPAINPFKQKGSVLKGHEMFGATQPSSIGRHLPSGVSSRPSPDVYNDFTSPIKRGPITSSPPPYSPLAGRNDTSPLQSSVHNLLRSKSMQERAPPVTLRVSAEQSQSSDLGHGERLVSSFPVPEPRQYIPMKTSQEHRVQKASSGSDLEESDLDSDSDMDDIAQKKKRREAKNQIQRQLSEVSMQRIDVEVPSTGRKGRRRSESEDYLAQCSGLDARDTQEVIADSQTAELPAFSTAQTRISESDSGDRLPANKIQSDVGIIPETSSPYNTHYAPILPMGDIASLSFSGETQDIDAPGFTQDLAFENAMRPFSSQPNLKEGTPAEREDIQKESSSNKELLPAKVDQPPIDDILVEHSPPTEREAIQEASHAKKVDVTLIFEKEPSIMKASTRLQDGEILQVDDKALRLDAPEEIILVGDISSSLRGKPTEETIKAAPKYSRLKLQNSSDIVKTPTPRRSARANPSSAAPLPMSRSSRPSSSALSTPLSSVPPSLHSPVTNSSPSTATAKKSTTKRKSVLAKNEPVSTRSSKRKSAITGTRDGSELVPTRTSKRMSAVASTRDSSADPLAGPTNQVAADHPRIFDNMAFAISYVRLSKEKDAITRKISAEGGQMLDDGFSVLFDPLTLRNQDTDLSLSPIAQSIGFVALIADEHSRKAKYIEALALGLPCLSGRWIEACVTKGQLVSWAPYLLCAGHSSFLNAIPSRTLQPYPAADAKFVETFARREKMLTGKSVLLVTGKGQTAEAKKAYVFLTRILGPSQLVQVVDCESARKKLLEYEEKKQTCDLVYVDNEKTANVNIFGLSGSIKSKKRKSRGADITSQAPKRIRMVNDEVIVQSLIVGQFLDE